MQVHRRRKRIAVTGIAVAALGASALTIATANHASAEEGCEVDYNVVSSWGGGFQASVTITANEPINGWNMSWDFPSGTTVSSAWNVDWSQSGTTFTGSDVGWNASIASGESREVFGFVGNGSSSAPAQISVNGDVCDGQGGGGETTTPGEDPTSPGTGDPGDKVDNPYDGAQVYVNPIWSANAAAEPGGDAVANEPTGVWLDQTSAIYGNGSPTTGSYGLADHLDEAVSQGADLIQIVIYNLPGRDCAALASNGQLGPDQIDEYKTEYIDEIVDIMGDPAYADLKIVNVIEIDSLPNLVTNVSPRETATANCDEMLANGNYEDGVSYAAAELGSLPNTYNYIDAGHHGWIGWGDQDPQYDNFHASAELFGSLIGQNGMTADDVHGFISNTANYSVLEEPYWEVDQNVGGQPLNQNPDLPWVDWNDFNSEKDFTQAFREELIDNGYNQNIGMLIDTSRNGWGGDYRPTGPSSSNDPVEFVDESRIDQRIQKGNWCNQAGAGLGERPQASPEPWIDAYVWIKPPGESDGSSELIDNDEGKGFDEMCDPDYQGNPRNGNNPSGARDNMPISGHWSSEQFQELLENAYPPIN
ncbi:glycoside hydrolase family 6 protein [Glycomyces sp. L485]|uniref:glycoside hydrolase family 6 protein n=1 Tax=Glycomyces sp. L485 TaxID=2909235 RepID=UPI001F4B9179|nr:glycoside hydrolase family 6 protein [Glycomyces sp. L485]MCH7231783.1 glycoside hydrolase family 6 protein [Glycomyces sp. L485]